MDKKSKRFQTAHEVFSTFISNFDRRVRESDAQRASAAAGRAVAADVAQRFAERLSKLRQIRERRRLAKT